MSEVPLSQYRRPKRSVHGILLLDKPLGMTSNEALLQVRRLYQAEKAGHTGTLDPLATGLLPICLGQTTKLTPYLLDAGKRYLARVRFGAATTTGDAEGDVIATSNTAGLSIEQLRIAATAFAGVILQKPPMYSAIKQAGVRLFELARAGVDVEREARPVSIHSFVVHTFDGEYAEVEIGCGKGTYIRTLAEDWARSCRQVAHLAGLRRLAVSRFDIGQAQTLPSLTDLSPDQLDARLIPSRQALPDWSAVSVSEEQARDLQQGRSLAWPGAVAWVAIQNATGRLLGLGELTVEGRLQPRRWFGIDGI